MKKILLIIAVIFGGASLVLAQATTMPAVQQNLKVLVIPFTPIGGTTSHEWVGAAIQENLMTDVAGSPSVWALGFDHPIPNGDVAQATAQARNTGASLVVFGAYQFTTDNQLRITGQVLDVNAGRAVATLKATGALVDLFKLEDSLSGQVQAVLPQQPGNVPASNLPTVSYGPNQSPTPVYASNPEQVVVPDTAATPPVTTYVYSSPTYVSPDYGYTYPYYGYSYPYYGYPYYYGSFPVIIGGGFRSGFGFRGGFGGHGGFVGHGGFAGHGGGFAGHGGFGHR